MSVGDSQTARGGLAVTRWGVVFVVFVAGLVAAGHIGMLPAALPAIRAELGIDLVTAGWVLSIFSVAGVGLGMLAGVFADHLGARRVLLGSFVVMAVGAGLGASVTSESWLLLARIFEGLGYVGAVVSGPPIILRATGAGDRRLALGLWGAYMPTGLAVLLLAAPLLGPLGWRGFWWLVAGVTLLWALAIWLKLPDDEPRGAKADTGAWAGEVGATLARPGLWCLGFCFSVYSLPWMALMAWLPSYLVEQRGLSLALAAQLTVLAVAINIFGNLLGGWLLQRGATRWSLLLTTALLTGFCGIGIFSDLLSDAWRYAFCLIFSCFSGVLPPAAFAGVSVFVPSPRQVGAGNGFLVQGSAIGQLAGPPIIAAAVSLAGGWQGGVWIFAGCGIVGTVFALAVRLLEARQARRA
ncbi:MAG TPA: MFS transporter [Alphaproteobacteria bacterium]|jgi:MFS family permease